MVEVWVDVELVPVDCTSSVRLNTSPAVTAGRTHANE
jgi:hypothetical protein